MDHTQSELERIVPGCEALLARPIQFLRIGRLGKVMRSDETLHKHGIKKIYIYIWDYMGIGIIYIYTCNVLY